MLGICKKAGKLAEGFDPVAELAKKSGARLILTACDLSPKSLKEIARVASMNTVEHMGLSVTMDEIWQGLGRRSGILAVADEGLAESVKKAAEDARDPAADRRAGLDSANVKQSAAALKEENGLCQ